MTFSFGVLFVVSFFSRFAKKWQGKFIVNLLKKCDKKILTLSREVMVLSTKKAPQEEGHGGTSGTVAIYRRRLTSAIRVGRV